jgi:YegS/Rv2252/BmrU family lipid kinase
MRIAVVAHTKKSLDGGLPALREELRRRGHSDANWFEIRKSRFVAEALTKAFNDEPELILLWGGDGTVQHAIDTMARKAAPSIPVAVIPAGTANLFASNLGIPHDLADAVDIALSGHQVRLDVGSFNGERFGVMAGLGFDALMISEASGALKNRFGRAAYLWTGTKNLTAASVRASIRVDGKRWFDGKTGCVLVANMGDLFGGLTLFDNADPTDGRLDIAVLHTANLREWAGLARHVLAGKAETSPYLSTTSGQRFDIVLDRRLPLELDGGDGAWTRRVKVRIKKAAITVCVPRDGKV